MMSTCAWHPANNSRDRAACSGGNGVSQNCSVMEPTNLSIGNPASFLSIIPMANDNFRGWRPSGQLSQKRRRGFSSEAKAAAPCEVDSGVIIPTLHKKSKQDDRSRPSMKGRLSQEHAARSPLTLCFHPIRQTGLSFPQ